MRGHIAKRGPNYVGVVDIGRQPSQRCLECRHRVWVPWGRPEDTCTKCGGAMGEVIAERRQRWLASHRTKRAAEAEVRNFLAGVEAGGDPVPADLRVDQWVERWLVSDRVKSLRSQTFYRYRHFVTAHVVPVIGAMQLTAVRARHVNAVLEHVASSGVGASTVTQARAAMSSCFRAAVELELLAANPVASTRPPRKVRPKLRVPTAAQLGQLIEAALGTPWEAAILLAATTGARRSEILGLQWENVDLVAGKVRIVAGLQRVRDDQGSRLSLLDTKTAGSRREIALPPFAVERLRRWRTAQNERRLALGPAWRDEGFVTDRGDGAAVDPDGLSAAFRRIADEVGLTGVRLHDARHGVATLLLEAGTHPSVAASVLGHSSPAVTLNVYSHVGPGLTERAAGAIESALGGPT